MPGRDRSPRGSSGRGFTIVELLLVLVLMALLAATTVRFYFSHGEITLENAAILLARDIRSAQHRSIFLNEGGRLTFLPDGSGYVLTDEIGVIAHNPQTDEPFLRRYPEDGVFHGVSILEAIAGGDRTLDIDARGAPLEDLSVTLDFRGDRRTVIVTRKSGAITIVGSTSGWVDADG